MSAQSLATATDALVAGRWAEARSAFEQALAVEDSAEGRFGLACALWWLGDSRRCVAEGARAYAGFRRTGAVEGAVRCAVWLAITYKANFARPVLAGGWLGRAERLLAELEPGPLHGWAHVARAYRMPDLEAADTLTTHAGELARGAGDLDLELVALAQLGLIRVGAGREAEGFALIDEAMAATLAGEAVSLDTAVYACCDMLTACELAGDLERAEQWCEVAEDFVATYGCPFLYAECRTYYGSLLVTRGRWEEAGRELTAGLRISAGCGPGVRARVLGRLATLRVRQGRLEEAQRLLADVEDGVEADAEVVLAEAALSLAAGDAVAAAERLTARMRRLEPHIAHLAAALDLLVDAGIATGDTCAAQAAAARLLALASGPGATRRRALAAAAQGRVQLAAGDAGDAVAHLDEALASWAALGSPFDVARCRYELARALAGSSPEQALAELRRSLGGFDHLGATLHAERAVVAMRALGSTPRTGHRAPAGALTARQQQVLALLAAGLSNPEIAERLQVSRKTAAHHVSHILTKLNLRNRAEAAAYAASSSATAAPGPA